jgi:hypothetical protein
MMSDFPRVHAARLSKAHCFLGWFAVLFMGWMLSAALGSEGDEMVVCPPIPMSEKAFFEKDYVKERRAWEQKQLIEPAKLRWAGKPWEADAVALVEETFDTMMEPRFKLGQLAGRFKALLKVCGEDSLLEILGANICFREKWDWRASRDMTLPLLARSGLPSKLEMFLLEHRQQEMEQEGVSEEGLSARKIQALVRALSDPTYGPEAEAILLRDVMNYEIHNGVLKTKAQITDWVNAVAGCQRSEWFKLTLQGHYEVKLAWKERGTKWAELTTEAQWEGMKKHLALARQMLERAYQLHPERPEAAAEMITVAMGDSNHEELRVWFDRTVEAQFDYAPAYSNYLYALWPRWAGSHVEMIAFGIACAGTRRYDTDVPSVLFKACLDVVNEIKNNHLVFRSPEVKVPMLAMLKGYMDEPDLPKELRHLRMSDAAVGAWLLDEDMLAESALLAAGDQLHQEARAKLAQLKWHEVAMRAEIAADTGKYGEALRTAVNPKTKEEFENMSASLRKIDLKTLSPEASAYLFETKARFEFPKLVEKGGWVPLPYDKHRLWMSNDVWYVRDSDHSLVLNGRDRFNDDVSFQIPFKDGLEVSGEFALDLPENVRFSADGCGVGMALGWPQEEGEPVRFIFLHSSGGVSTARAYAGDYNNGPPVRFVSFHPQNTFSLRLVNGMLSYDLNGERMSGLFKLPDYKRMEDLMRITFLTYRLPMGAQARFRNLRVRKINSMGLEPPLAPKLAVPVKALKPEVAALSPALWTLKIPLADLMVRCGIGIAALGVALMLTGLLQTRFSTKSESC